MKYLQAILLFLLLIPHWGCVPPRQEGAANGGGANEGETMRRVLWYRLHGAGDVTTPPILRIPVNGKRAGIGSDALTLTLDLQAQAIPNLSLQLVHCDRNWKPTQNIFVQDATRLQSSDFTISIAPFGATHYDYTATITFPTGGSLLRIEHSGNYLARVVDYFNPDNVLLETRFFVVEPSAAMRLFTYSDFYETRQATALQTGLRVNVETELDFSLFSTQLRAVHLYNSGAWFSPMVANVGDQFDSLERGRYWARWNSAFGTKAVIEFGNIPAGNEHRLLDLTDLSYYPSTGGLISTPLSDQPRQWPNTVDHNGTAPERYVGDIDNDYLYFQFRLDLFGQKAKEDICVVGTFNNWLPTRNWRMFYDEKTGYYLARGLIKRAFHEYQYVAGTWDEDAGILRYPDATLLEGNSRQASQLFYAFVYYSETTSGGYDRIVGVGAVVS